MDRPTNLDDWNQRAIPTVPQQRPPQPADTWTATNAARVPRQHPRRDTN
ncbi:hypothetical protein [Streptomyces chryseus]|nr:hypothetical protein [Streptomyces chryseus]GGX36392.1 hypothetical protein GCM10010353_59300 [Streptomyces chryseus]